MKNDKRFINKIEENMFSLTIFDIKKEDQATYKAVLKNKAGQIDSNEAMLTVTCKFNFF